MGKRGKAEFIQVLAADGGLLRGDRRRRGVGGDQARRHLFRAVKHSSSLRWRTGLLVSIFRFYPYLPAPNVATTSPADYLALVSREAA